MVHSVVMSARLTAASVLIVGLACRPNLQATAEAAQSAEQCRGNRNTLIELLESLPEKGLALRGRADLPVASLGGVIGAGQVVDVASDSVLLDGQGIEGQNPTERLEQLGARLSEIADGLPASSVRPLIYLAVEGSMDVRTLRGFLAAIPRTYDAQLVFQAPVPDAAAGSPQASVSERLLTETDLPLTRRFAGPRCAPRCSGPCPSATASISTASPCASSCSPSSEQARRRWVQCRSTSCATSAAGRALV